MPIAISPDQLALADSVRGLARRTVSSDYLRAQLDAKTLDVGRPVVQRGVPGGCLVPDEDVAEAVDRGWQVARNTLSNERVSLGNKDLPIYASIDGLLKWAAHHDLDAILLGLPRDPAPAEKLWLLVLATGVPSSAEKLSGVR
ncbi:hypothetical protein [Nocardia nepalensis]|uniref:hypothetical protein n=1 Tax=Nocardia nepalensis TaxID=3375448 RepID=UPI003B682651